MTDRIALFIGVLVACALAADYYFNDLEASFFLSRKTVDLIEWLAFWR